MELRMRILQEMRVVGEQWLVIAGERLYVAVSGYLGIFCHCSFA